MKVARRIAAVSAVLLFAALGAAAAGFACTPQARIVGVTPQAARPGDPVTVKGEHFAGGRVVELRWNGVRDAVVGTAVANSRGDVLIPATIPEAEPGVHTLVAVSPGMGSSRTTFEVTGTPAERAESPAGRRAVPSRPAAGGAIPGPVVVGAAVLGAGLVAAGAFAAVTGRRRAVARTPAG